MIENIVSKMFENNDAEMTHLNRLNVVLKRLEEVLKKWLKQQPPSTDIDLTIKILDLIIQQGEALEDIGTDLINRKAILEEIRVLLAEQGDNV